MSDQTSTCSVRTAVRVGMRHGSSRTFPVVERDSSARWASAASARGNVAPTRTSSVAGAHGVEQLARAPVELVAGGDVVVERGAGQEERAGRVEALRVDRGDRTGRAAEQDERPAAAQRGQRRVERVLADGVEDGVHASAVGQRPHLGRQVAGQVVELAVPDHVGGARLARQALLLGAAHGRDDPGTPLRRELREQQADAPGGRVHEHVVPGLDGERRGHEVVRGEALEGERGGDLVGDAVGDQQRLRLPDAHQLGVGAGCRRPGDPVTDGDLADVGADRDDRPGALRAHDVRERHRVDAGPAVGVDEVDPGGGDADEDLVGGGLGVGELGELEDVGTAGGGGSDGAHGSANAADGHGTFPGSVVRIFVQPCVCSCT